MVSRLLISKFNKCPFSMSDIVLDFLVHNTSNQPTEIRSMKYTLNIAQSNIKLHIVILNIKGSSSTGTPT